MHLPVFVISFDLFVFRLSWITVNPILQTCLMWRGRGMESIKWRMLYNSLVWIIFIINDFIHTSILVLYWIITYLYSILREWLIKKPEIQIYTLGSMIHFICREILPRTVSSHVPPVPVLGALYTGWAAGSSETHHQFCD